MTNVNVPDIWHKVEQMSWTDFPHNFRPFTSSTSSRESRDQSKEIVQRSYYADSIWLYSAISKPNMIIKTKKLSIFWNYLDLICKAEIPYLPPFYLNHKFLIKFYLMSPDNSPKIWGLVQTISPNTGFYCNLTVFRKYEMMQKGKLDFVGFFASYQIFHYLLRWFPIICMNI